MTQKIWKRGIQTDRIAIRKTLKTLAWFLSCDINYIDGNKFCLFGITEKFKLVWEEYFFAKSRVGLQNPVEQAKVLRVLVTMMHQEIGLVPNALFLTPRMKQ